MHSGTGSRAGSACYAGPLTPLNFMTTRPPFALQQIDHVVLRVRDEAAMVAFYCDVLGCTVERRQDAIGLVQLRAGRSLIDLVPVAGKLGAMGGAAPGVEGRNMDHLFLFTDPSTLEVYAPHLHADQPSPCRLVRLR